MPDCCELQGIPVRRHTVQPGVSDKVDVRSIRREGAHVGPLLQVRQTALDGGPTEVSAAQDRWHHAGGLAAHFTVSPVLHCVHIPSYCLHLQTLAQSVVWWCSGRTRNSSVK